MLVTFSEFLVGISNMPTYVTYKLQLFDCHVYIYFVFLITVLLIKHDNNASCIYEQVICGLHVKWHYVVKPSDSKDGYQ